MSKSDSSDTQFFNSFSMVLGILITFAIVIFAYARSVGADTQSEAVLLEPLHLCRSAEEHCAVRTGGCCRQGQFGLSGCDRAGERRRGGECADHREQAFTQVCSACHATGVNGAPKIGDHAAWAPRIAQGKDTLYKDAIAGKGNMPPKGGTNWPDATIKMTVDYMISLNK